MSRSETVTNGHDTIGIVISNERGHEAYGEGGKYLATYPTLPAARRAVFLHSKEATSAQTQPSS